MPFEFSIELVAALAIAVLFKDADCEFNEFKNLLELFARLLKLLLLLLLLRLANWARYATDDVFGDDISDGLLKLDEWYCCCK